MSKPDRDASGAARQSTYRAETTYGTWGNKDRWRAVTGESLSSGMIVSNPSASGASIAAAGDTLSPVPAGRGRSSW